MIKLSNFDIKSQPRSLIKAKILASFLVECTILDELIEPKEAKPLDSSASTEGPTQSSTSTWKIYVDGLSNSKGLGVRIIIASLEGIISEHARCLEFPAINN